MKFIIIFLFFSFSALSASSQSPVSWEFTAKHLRGSLYEVHLTATIQAGWHMFSQKQPANALPLPTRVNFQKNPLILLKGLIVEEGKMTTYKEKTLGFVQNQYADHLDFIQTVSLRRKVVTTVSGNVLFQVCNDHECLPPTSVKFSILIN